MENNISDETLKAAIQKVLAEKTGDLGSDRSGDPRPTDAEVFFAILPGILGAYAAKSTTSRDALSSGFLMAREATGQCCIMGIARHATMCTDGSHLAIMPQQVNVPGVQGPVAANQDASRQGVMTQQYPSPGGQQVVGMQQPGPGGMVAQYPTVGGPGGAMVVQGGPIGQQNGDGRGMRAVVVSMTPNDPNVHPIAAPQAPPQQQGFPQQQPPQYPQNQAAPPPGYR